MDGSGGKEGRISPTVPKRILSGDSGVVLRADVNERQLQELSPEETFREFEWPASLLPGFTGSEVSSLSSPSESADTDVEMVDTESPKIGSSPELELVNEEGGEANDLAQLPTKQPFSKNQRQLRSTDQTKAESSHDTAVEEYEKIPGGRTENENPPPESV